MSKKKIESVSKLTIPEFKELLGHIINNNRHLQKVGKTPVAVCGEGVSGLGKTQSIQQVAKEHDLQFVRINLSELDELADLIGFPRKEYEVEVPGEGLKFVDELAINGYHMTGKSQTGYAPPQWIANVEKGGILLLDDYTRADTRFLQACMTLIETQEYISWKLPADWHIILSTNPADGSYMVNEIDTAMKTRYMTVKIKFDVGAWAKWAEAAGIDGRCINFILLNPEQVTEEVNPRAITNYFNSIASFSDFQKNLPMIQLIGEGSVGSEFATAFTLFINNKLDRLITPERMMKGEWKKVSEEMIDCIGKGAKYRADIASVLTTRIINYSLALAKNSNVPKEILERLISFCNEDVLGSDLKYIIVKNLVGKEPKFKDMVKDKQVNAMLLKN